VIDPDLATCVGRHGKARETAGIGATNGNDLMPAWNTASFPLEQFLSAYNLRIRRSRILNQELCSRTLI
jgi:hypothetical protein